MKRFFVCVFFTISLCCADAHIFIYHRFNDARYPSTSVSNENLRAQFDYFKDNGYEVVPLSKITQAVKNGEEINPKWIALTIDDGYKSFYENGLPIFREYGYPFALMVYVEASDKKYGDYMTFEQIKEVSQIEGAEIGYHSYGHRHMVSLSEEKLRADFKNGVEIFEKHMGFQPKYFAYPYGEYDDKVKETSLEYGLEVLLNQNSGAVSNKSDLSDLNRTPLADGTNLKAALFSKFLNADWLSPTNYPKNGVVENITIKTDENVSSGYLYVTAHGSRKIEVKDGLVSINLDTLTAKPIRKNHIRIALSINNKTTTKILVKDINAE